MQTRSCNLNLTSYMSPCLHRMLSSRHKVVNWMIPLCFVFITYSYTISVTRTPSQLLVHHLSYSSVRYYSCRPVLSLRIFLPAFLHCQKRASCSVDILPQFLDQQIDIVSGCVRMALDGLLTTSCKLIVKTCYPQACCKLFQQVLTSLQTTSCNKPDFD